MQYLLFCHPEIACLYEANKGIVGEAEPPDGYFFRSHQKTFDSRLTKEEFISYLAGVVVPCKGIFQGKARN